MVFSCNNRNEDLPPVIVGALFGMGRTSTEGYRESLEEMVQGTSTLKRIYCTTSLISEKGYCKGSTIAWLL